jgi:hypothetical protein
MHHTTAENGLAFSFSFIQCNKTSPYAFIFLIISLYVPYIRNGKSMLVMLVVKSAASQIYQ